MKRANSSLLEIDDLQSPDNLFLMENLSLDEQLCVDQENLLHVPPTIDVGPENVRSVLHILHRNCVSELDLGQKKLFLLKSYFRENPIRGGTGEQ